MVKQYSDMKGEKKMSKELEALNILRENHIQFTKEKYGNLDKRKLQNIINRKLARWTILEEALKRNEPMKVGIQVYTNGFFKNWCCENCHNSIEEKYANYCPDCGQKLEWSEKLKKDAHKKV